MTEFPIERPAPAKARPAPAKARPPDGARRDILRAMDESRSPDGTVLVRPAVEADLDEVVDQTWAVAAEGRWLGTEVPFDRAGRRERLSSMLSAEFSTLLVADTAPGGGPGVVGHISVSLAPYGVADIGMLVKDEWRRKGLGTALLAAAISWATAAGAHRIALEVWPDNTAALRLYRRAGFVEEGRKRRHYRRRNGELWDSVLMGLPLSPQDQSWPLHCP
jgi:putative acetyltransferase